MAKTEVTFNYSCLSEEQRTRLERIYPTRSIQTKDPEDNIPVRDMGDGCIIGGPCCPDTLTFRASTESNLKKLLESLGIQFPLRPEYR